MTEQCKVCGFPHDGDSHSDCIYAQSKEIERLRSELDKRRWIPVSELPKEKGDYLGLNWRGYQEVIFFEKEKLFEYCGAEGKRLEETSGITHWMPLPEPPEVL